MSETSKLFESFNRIINEEEDHKEELNEEPQEVGSIDINTPDYICHGEDGSGISEHFNNLEDAKKYAEEHKDVQWIERWVNNHNTIGDTNNNPLFWHKDDGYEALKNLKEPQEALRKIDEAEVHEEPEETGEPDLSTKEGILKALIEEEEVAINSYNTKLAMLKDMIDEEDYAKAEMLFNHITPEEEQHKAELTKYLETGEVDISDNSAPEDSIPEEEPVIEESEDSVIARKYYVLDTDNYGQPSGTVSEEFLTPEEAAKTSYCYDNEEDALRRAQD